MTASQLTVTGAFGCNGKAAQPSKTGSNLGIAGGGASYSQSKFNEVVTQVNLLSYALNDNGTAIP